MTNVLRPVSHNYCIIHLFMGAALCVCVCVGILIFHSTNVVCRTQWQWCWCIVIIHMRILGEKQAHLLHSQLLMLAGMALPSMLLLLPAIAVCYHSIRCSGCEHRMACNNQHHLGHYIYIVCVCIRPAPQMFVIVIFGEWILEIFVIPFGTHRITSE